MDPPEALATLRSIAVELSPRADLMMAYAIRISKGTRIVAGNGLWLFLHYYARASATIRSVAAKDSIDLSEQWAGACSGLVTTLEWMSSPGRGFRVPDFPLTPRQVSDARNTAEASFVFALCHEIAHVLLDHEGADALHHEAGLNESAQRQEIDADKVGLMLLLKSSGNAIRSSDAAIGAVYLNHALELLNVRLMLLGDLVDADVWSAGLTHPPALQRFFALCGVALSHLGDQGVSQLMLINSQLSGFDREVIQFAGDRQERVLAAIGQLIHEAARSLRSATRSGETGISSRQRQAEAGCSAISADIVDAMNKLLAESPLGVMQGLASERHKFSTGRRQQDTIARSVVEQLIAALPSEFSRFMMLSRVERTHAIVGSAGPG